MQCLAVRDQVDLIVEALLERGKVCDRAYVRWSFVEAAGSAARPGVVGSACVQDEAAVLEGNMDANTFLADHDGSDDLETFQRARPLAELGHGAGLSDLDEQRARHDDAPADLVVAQIGWEVSVQAHLALG